MRAFLASVKIQVKMMLVNNLIQFIVFIQPILYGTLMYFMFRDSGSDNFIGYIVLGTGMMNLWSTIVFSAANAIDRERSMGTLEIISAVPTSFQTIIFGKIVGSIIVGLLSSINGYIYIMLISGASFHIEHPMLFILNFIIVVISFVTISVMTAALFALSRQVRNLINVAEFPVFILSGLMFPLSVLPVWTRPFSYMLSPTWGVKVLRMCIGGITDMTEYYTSFTALLAITVLYLVISFILYKRMTQSFRRTGSLGVV